MEQKNNIEIKRELLNERAELHVREAAAEGEQSRTITGYAILFNTPSAALHSDEESEVREVIAPEAITKELLDSSDIKFTMYHDRQIILGRSNRGSGSLEYFIDERGVGFNLDLPKSPNGDEALELVRRGDISGCSFAFSTRYRDKECVSRSVVQDGDRQLITYTVRAITGLYDFTLAADPAYPATSVEAREFIRGLLSDSDSQDEEAPKGNENINEQLRQMRDVASRKLI